MGFGRNKKRFFKAEGDSGVLSSKASGPADPQLCKADRRKWGVMEVGTSMQWGLETAVCQPNLEKCSACLRSGFRAVLPKLVQTCGCCSSVWVLVILLVATWRVSKLTAELWRIQSVMWGPSSCSQSCKEREGCEDTAHQGLVIELLVATEIGFLWSRDPAWRSKPTWKRLEFTPVSRPMVSLPAECLTWKLELSNTHVNKLKSYYQPCERVMVRVNSKKLGVMWMKGSTKLTKKGLSNSSTCV